MHASQTCQNWKTGGTSSQNMQYRHNNFCCHWDDYSKWMTAFQMRKETGFLIFHFDKLDEWVREKARRHPAPRATTVLQTFLILFPLCHTKICCLTYKLIYKLHFSMNPFHCGSGPLNTFIRAKNSFANETQRSAALPHRETGCLPIVRAAWERRGSSAQPGPAHLSRLKADPV